MDSEAPSEVSSRWESDGSAIFEDIEERPYLPLIVDQIEEEKKIEPSELEAAI